MFKVLGNQHHKKKKRIINSKLIIKQEVPTGQVGGN
jgi:hypothetical protein